MEEPSPNFPIPNPNIFPQGKRRMLIGWVFTFDRFFLDESIIVNLSQKSQPRIRILGSGFVRVLGRDRVGYDPSLNSCDQHFLSQDRVEWVSCILCVYS
ncbi:DEAD-box ATP-dependent RNA helicase 42 isoform X2 [Iris pallida]|uniref:DEAD-box ATP-dependent RNA helicase 42 isoform X2 n=1 Tax=Iris pallida TaxID=29817 RepID=A0AAX6DQJ6_IRIPA|nr:DEAD-box ATP-dependent RNA helicase 42 isoform X2 [Iris pallida]